MKHINRRKRELQIRFRGILAVILLAAAVAGVIWYVRTRPPREVQQGVSKIQQMESQEVSEVEDTIREAEETRRRNERAAKLEEARKKQEAEKKAEADAEAKKAEEEQKLLEDTVNATMEQIDSGGIDVWSLFGDVFILGDSRSEPFSYYSLLDDSRVFAIKGANLRKADQGVAQAETANVGNLIFTYGLNDANGNWATAPDFIAKYEEVIEQYRAVLPDAKIYIASIAGVTDRAISGSPALAQIPAYNQEIRKLCEEKHYVYIECETLLTEHEDLYAPDGEHFNRELYDVWGKLMIREVLLHENNPAPGGDMNSDGDSEDAASAGAGHAKNGSGTDEPEETGDSSGQADDSTEQADGAPAQRDDASGQQDVTVTDGAAEGDAEHDADSGN